MPELTLYHFQACPYCTKVRNYLEKNGITVKRKDIRQEPKYRDELIAIGGKGQVPCLVIDGKALYESDDIIAWFKSHHGKE